mgnify:CR=1 FL=1
MAWGNQNLFAYGCGNDVMVVDVLSGQTVCSLVGHSSEVAVVSWCVAISARPYPCLRVSCMFIACVYVLAHAHERL